MNKVLEIDGRRIGPGSLVSSSPRDVTIISGNLETAKEMARQAKVCGADAIKFQHHLPDEEMLREGVPMSAHFNLPLYEFRQRYALKLEQHAELIRYCREIGIIYLCTPFSRKAAEEIHGLGVGAFKIGSGELTNLPTFEGHRAIRQPHDSFGGNGGMGGDRRNRQHVTTYQ